jgi:vacuolar-type H+-ATPase subunit H
MTQIELNQLERDVEDARERLSGDLKRLRSPATLSGFKDALWAEADESRDHLVAKAKETADELVIKAKEATDQLVTKTKEAADELVTTAKEAVRDRAWRFVADIKERAAANPAAALAIGAGLAWRSARKPPIASILVGVGVIGLMRTNPQNPSPGAEMVSRVGDLAVEGKEKVEQWASDAGVVVARAGELAGSVQGTVEQWSSDAGETIWQVAGATKSLTKRGSETIYGIVQDAEERDKYLLGAAAVALVAAIGIRLQRRAS